MLASSMSTGEIPGARRLWRAQTNPYAAQNPARASMPDPHLQASINDRRIGACAPRAVLEDFGRISTGNSTGLTDLVRNVRSSDSLQADARAVPTRAHHTYWRSLCRKHLPRRQNLHGVKFVFVTSTGPPAAGSGYCTWDAYLRRLRSRGAASLWRASSGGCAAVLVSACAFTGCSRTVVSRRPRSWSTSSRSSAP